ncbi:MAG: hypothetical protein JNK15_18780, partial [Planctomycetes bacterium]|nr:hypothetical protein [Planctomycetota bacterium]
DARYARTELDERPPTEAWTTGGATVEVGPELATHVQLGDVLRLELGSRARRVTVRLSAPGGNGGDVPIGDVDGLGVLFVPSPGTTLAGHVVLLHERFDVFSGDHAEKVAAVRAAAAAAAAPGEPAAWRVARQALGADNLRQALLAVATPLAAATTVDLILVADERTLRAFADALPPHQEGPLSPTMGWPLQRAVWQALLPALERDALPSSLFAVGIEHLGAVVDDTATLRSVLAEATDEAHLQRRLHDENVIALADRDAVRRVRAHDWLLARGLAVAGFDPLAPLATRRESLRGAAVQPPKDAGR